MKRVITAITLLSLTTSLFSEGLESYQEDSDAIYETSAGSDDSSFKSIATSMLGWGIGLAIGIAVTASVLKHSNGKSPTSTPSQ